MNISDVNLKLGMVATVAIGAVLLATFHSVAIANPDGHCDTMQMSAERVHESMKGRMGKLAGRLEIKPAQQTAWDEFSRSVETLAEWHAKEPGVETDAATILHYSAARMSEYARKLTIVADASAKLEVVLTDEQKKTFNQASRRFLHDHHGWHHFHEQSHGNDQREGDMHGQLEGDSSRDAS